MKIRFFLKTSVVNKAGESPIRCNINIRGTRIQKLIGYSVPYDKDNPDKSKWDYSKEIVRHGVITSNGADYRVINAMISAIKSHFQAFELSTSAVPSIQELNLEFEKAIKKQRAKIAAINNQDTPEVIEQKVTEAETEAVVEAETKDSMPKTKSAVEYMDEFIREERILRGWSPETLRMINSFKHHLIRFNKKATLDYYDTTGLEKFITYLRSKCGLEENSVLKQYKNLGWFLRWAIRKGYTQVRDIESFDPVFKLVKKPVIFLDKEELEKLYKYKIPKNGKVVKLKTYEGAEYDKTVYDADGMARTRDLFCFCAFTGLRYSDVVEVRRVDINDGVLNITTQKTHDRLPIVLHENALAILNKYKKQEFPGGKALPYITNQQMNRCLKLLCELCGFNTPYTVTYYRNGVRHDDVLPKYELISTHAGRKTFICFALSNGIAPDVVMKFTGHSDYKSMKPYIDITEDAKKEAIKKMEEAFKKNAKKDTKAKG